MIGAVAVSRASMLRRATILRTAAPAAFPSAFPAAAAGPSCCNALLQRRGLSAEAVISASAGSKSLSGWAPPAGGVADSPYFVHRTGTGNLPVYTDIRARGTRVLTKVRLVRGDLRVRGHGIRASIPITRAALFGPPACPPVRPP
eukprot:SAG22_NODE_7757_length_710_cov_2.220025_1_plen_144_part_01